jgi:hypothetical protein
MKSLINYASFLKAAGAIIKELLTAAGVGIHRHTVSSGFH